jgi:hypothetical protein
MLSSKIEHPKIVIQSNPPGWAKIQIIVRADDPLATSGLARKHNP